MPGFPGIAPDPEAKDDLALLAVGQIESDLDCRAGVESGADLSGKTRTPQGSRILQRTVAPDELCPVAAHRARRVVDIEERNAPGELPRIAQTLAELRGIDLATVAQATTRNARELFGLD